MLSKKLLETIYPNTERYTYRIVSGNVEAVDHNWQGIIGTINIYEVAHKCKEWAWDKGYIISSGRTTSNDFCTSVFKVMTIDPYSKELTQTWGVTEPEAIFTACEWILKQGELDEQRL